MTFTTNSIRLFATTPGDGRPVNEPARGGTMSLECPKCQSGEVQSLSVIYQAGFSTGTGSTTVSLPGAGSVAATHTVTAQTELSRRAAPPPAKPVVRSVIYGFLAGVYGFYSIPALQMWIVLHLAERVLDVGEVPPNLNYAAAGIVPDTYGLIALAIFGLCVFLVLRARAYNSGVHASLMERWRRSFLCRRCGEIFATS